MVSVKADLAKILLNTPAATELGEKVALSRRIDKHWRLIGALASFPSRFRGVTDELSTFPTFFPLSLPLPLPSLPACVGDVRLQDGVPSAEDRSTSFLRTTRRPASFPPFFPFFFPLVLVLLPPSVQESMQLFSCITPPSLSSLL